MAPGNLQNIIINNLFEVLKYYGLIDDRYKMAKFIGINYSTFRSWLSFNRTPSLKTLDKISDQLSIPTYVLLIPDLTSNDVDEYIVNDIINNSPLLLDKNLKIIYREKGLNNWRAIGNRYGPLLSQDSLKSYHREKDGRTPTIDTLEKMSTYLGIPAYKLIIGGYNNEYKN